MAASKKIIENAYQCYKECGTIEGASLLCYVPASTLHRWQIKYSWKERVEREKDALAENPFDQEKSVENFMKRINDQDVNDAEVLRHIKTLEGIALQCLKYSPEEMEEVKGMRPKNYNDVLKTFDLCFRTRSNLFHKIVNNSTTINNTVQKIDLIQELKDLHNDMDGEIIDAESSETSTKLLS